MQYFYITGKPLSLTHPTTYTEKLQYLRFITYPKDPLVMYCTDRYTAREYVKKAGYESILIPLLDYQPSFELLKCDHYALPFVIKATHASSFNHIAFSWSKEIEKKLQKKFRKWLATDYGKLTVEPHYSPIKPALIVERFIGEGVSLPIEYKIHVFNGVAKYLYVVTGRGEDIRYTHFLADWTPFPGAQFNGWKAVDYPLLEPTCFKQMLTIAETLGKPFPFVRVDLYLIRNNIYFSELTFTPAKGTLSLIDPQIDNLMGTWLELNQ